MIELGQGFLIFESFLRIDERKQPLTAKQKRKICPQTTTEYNEIYHFLKDYVLDDNGLRRSEFELFLIIKKGLDMLRTSYWKVD